MITINAFAAGRKGVGSYAFFEVGSGHSAAILANGRCAVA